MAKRWESVRLDEIEPIAVVNGTLLWRPVRRTLDIGAFGINAYVAPNAGDDVVEEHTERSLGHEEVYVVLAGRATFTLDDETVDAPAGTVVFIRDVDVKRHARAEEPGTSVLAIGGPRDAVYEPSAVGGLLRGGTASHRRGLRRLSRRAGGRSRTATRSPGSAVPRRVRGGAGRTTRRRGRASAASARAPAGARRARARGRGLRLVARATRLAAVASRTA